MDQTNTSKYIFQILQKSIHEVGEENVVGNVTDDATNCVGDEKIIMKSHQTIYQTPCAAWYLDLLLHD